MENNNPFKLGTRNESIQTPGFYKGKKFNRSKSRSVDNSMIVGEKVVSDDIHNYDLHKGRLDSSPGLAPHELAIIGNGYNRTEGHYQHDNVVRTNHGKLG